MSHQWGRLSGAGTWQRPKPVWFMSVIVVAITTGVAVWFYRQHSVWTPLQQFYLSAYGRSALASSLGIRTGRYQVLSIVNRRGARLAIDDEVVPVLTATGETAFALSELAMAVNTGRLVWREVSYNHAGLHEQLRQWIYADQTLFDLVRPSIIGALAVFIVGLLLAIPKDAARARARRHGRRLKGPELVSVRRFNRRTRADGVVFTAARGRPPTVSWCMWRRTEPPKSS